MRMRWLALVWACGLARLAFYATMLPLWEGYDEWSHFAVVRAVAAGDLLPSRDAPVPADVQASLRSAPVPWELRHLPPPARTQDDYWRAPATDQTAAPTPEAWPRLTAYEALQAPLYYWLMAPLLRICSGCGLPTQVLVLRWAAALMASLAIPLVFALAREVLADARLALGCAAVVAVMPGFAFDVARVGNDSLAVVLFTAFLLLAVRRAHWLATGIVLGLGLLTKAYFLAALIVVLWVPRAALAGLAISGWWYARNLWTTGTLSGLSESVMLRDGGSASLLHSAFAVPWRTAIDSILLSHLYFGGWSSLTVRSWMYHVFYALALAAGIGCLFTIRGNRGLFRLALLYTAFWLAQLYNVVLIYASKGVPTSMGWYMYAVVGAEVVLAVAGLRRVLGLRAPALGALLFGLLDLYATHFVAIPYYTGFIRHRPNGALEALHLSNLQPGLMLTRLAAFKAPLASPPVIFALWALYLVATAGAVIVCLKFARSSSATKAVAK